MAAQLDSVAGPIGKDLSASQQLALQHGHDSDFPLDEEAAMNVDPSQHGAESARSVSSTDRHESLDHEAEKTAAIVTTSEPVDSHLVDWDRPDDPANPLNWSAMTKASNLVVLSIMTLLTPLASSMFAPGVPELMRDFHTDSSLLATFVVSVYVLGFAFGPLIIAPLSELYGRTIIYHTCNVGFVVFTVACAYAPSMSALIVFRFFQGCWGVAPLTCGGGTIVDMVPAQRRGRIMSLWSLGPLLGPVIGPVAGGFIAEAIGWRWIFKILAIASSIVTLVAFGVLRESYHPTLLARKAAALRKATGDDSLRSKLDTGLSSRALFLRAIVRPTKMLLFSPICASMSLFMAVIYGFLYLLFTTFTFVFEDTYGFSESTVGLTYIGSGIGFFIGLFIMMYCSDAILARLTARNGGQIKPEYRLPPLVYSVPIIPVAFFIYGWTAQYKVHWVAPLFGTLILGIGLNIAFMAVCTYLVDSFAIYAASAMAANTVLRSIFGGVIPLFGLQMYDALGLGWGNSLLAFIALAMCPIPWLFYVYGERIRTNPRYQIKF